MKFTGKDISRNALLATLYFTLTMITYPVSFLGVQFRFAEILLLLCFFNPKYIVGLTLGCALANIPSAIGPIDIAFGTLATLASCLIICFSKHLAIACLFPIVINTFVIGAELFWVLKEPFWLSCGFVCLGETVVMVVGYIIVRFLKKKEKFFILINATRNTDFKF